MSGRLKLIGAALVLAALPMQAQERGTVEFGAFVGQTMFDNAYNMDNALIYGGRVGAYLDPRWALEFEGSGGTAGRPSGLADRSFRFIDARIVFVPIKIGRTALMIGGGGGHVDANVSTAADDEAYGYHALVGGRLALGPVGALRIDAIQYFNGGASHRTFRAGFSLYRNPFGKETTVTVAGPSTPQRADSVSAAETRRLRAADAALAALRDSLSRNRAVTMDPSSVASLATMLEMINFERDQSTLDDVSRAILRDKVPIFKANPQMRIVITGYASSPGTEAYNMALGFRRATAARDYLVSQGVSTGQIEISTRGENNLMVEGPSDVANAANRRGQFRILIADPYLRQP